MNGEVLETLARTLEVALAATALAAAVGIPLGIALSRRRGPLRGLLEALVTLPLVVPPTVLGYALLVCLGRATPFGRLWEGLFGFPLTFSLAGAVVAASVGAVPFVARGTAVALESLDGGLLETARTLGLSPRELLLRIELPLARRGIASGLLLAFARATGEFGATLMVAGDLPGRTRTAALAIHAALAAGREEEAFALSVALCLLSGLLLASSQLLLGSQGSARG